MSLLLSLGRGLFRFEIIRWNKDLVKLSRLGSFGLLNLLLWSCFINLVVPDIVRLLGVDMSIVSLSSICRLFLALDKLRTCLEILCVRANTLNALKSVVLDLQTLCWLILLIVRHLFDLDNLLQNLSLYHHCLAIVDDLVLVHASILHLFKIIVFTFPVWSTDQVLQVQFIVVSSIVLRLGSIVKIKYTHGAHCFCAFDALSSSVRKPYRLVCFTSLDSTENGEAYNSDN